MDTAESENYMQLCYEAVQRNLPDNSLGELWVL